MRHYAFVEQHSEEDCGAACVATVAKHYGKRVPLTLIRDLVGTGQQGTTLLGLRRGADELGFNCRALRTDVNDTFFDDVEQLTLPVILHWKGNHWVVLHAIERRKVVIADPGQGVLRLDKREFLDCWDDGVLLTLEPDMARLRQQPDERSKLGLIGRILRLARPYRPMLARAMALNAVVGLTGLGIPLLMQVLTDDVLVRRDVQLLGVLGIGMVFLYAFRSLIDFLERKIATYFFERLELSLLMEYGHNLFKMPMKYFDTHRSGDILNRIIETGRVSVVFNALLLDLPSDMFLAVVSLVVMSVYSPSLTLVAVPAYLLVVIVQVAFMPRMYEIAGRFIRRTADSQALLVEFFRGAQLIKSSNGGFQAWDEYQSIFGELANLSWRESQIKLLMDGSVEFLSSLLNIGLLVYGSTFVLSRQLTIGQLLAFSGLGMNVLLFFRNASRFAISVITDRSIFTRLVEVLDSEPEQKELSMKSWVKLSGKEPINLRRLCYAHPGRKQSFTNLSATIPGGQPIALVGASGSGKSTLIKLISGMYPPASGLIRFGQLSIADLSLECLRDQVCLVTQDSHFFSRSIIENFRFVRPNASYRSIVKACQISMADEFIVDLPNGYQTKLGEFGCNLSGGQKQRLAIARALIDNPPVLILDESTAALEPDLERRLLEKLLTYREGLTTILVSHRSSVVAKCNYLVYMEKGQIKQHGLVSDLAHAAVPPLKRLLSE